MKQTSRKKVLLSSVAMMMVATVSLGSATYAWFSQNTQATANGVNVKTVKGSNLVLSETNTVDSVWKSILDLNIDDKTLTPVSSKDCDDWFTTKATKYDVAATEEGGRGTITPVENRDAAGYYVAEEFYVKSIEESIIADFQVNVAATDSEAVDQLNYVRVALKKEDGTLTEIYGNNADHKSCLTSTSADTLGTQSITTSAITGQLTLTADTAQKVTLYIWFEGEDPDCKDTAAGVDVSVSVDFTKNQTIVEND